MKKKLVIATLALGLVALVPSVSEVKAAEVPSVPVLRTEDNSTIMPQADVIEVKYRIYNGKLQYRRWNATRGYWVDSTWKNV